MQSTALSLSPSSPAAPTGILMPPTAVASSPPVLRIIQPTARPEALRAALFEMARQGDCDAGRQLLQSGLVMPGASEPGTGECALMLAVENRQTSFVRMLLQSGATVDQCRADGMTSLMLAAAAGDAAIVEALLLAGAQVDHASSTGISSLILAAWSGMTEVVAMLLTAGATVDHATTFGWTALMRAAQGGHFDTLATLIANGSDVERVECNDRTALMIAAEAGHAATAQALANAGADTTRRDKVGLSAAGIAHATGHRKLAKVLSERASSQPVYLPDDDDPDATPKRETTRTAKTTWTTARADVSVKGTPTLVTAPATAPACSISVAAIATAMSAPACASNNPAARTSLSALLDAIANNDLKTLRRLLDILDKTSRNVTQRLDRSAPLPAFDGPDETNAFTPLMAAAYFGHAELIKTLASAGATVDLAGYKGRTALMIAAAMGHDAAVEALVGCGAVTSLTNDNGRTAADIALLERHEKTAVALSPRSATSALPWLTISQKFDEMACTMKVMELVVRDDADELKHFLAALITNHREMAKIMNRPVPVDGNHPRSANIDFPVIATPLTAAGDLGRVHLFLILIMAGAQINAPDHLGFHALYKASRRGDANVVKALLLYGAKVDHGGPEGCTALMEAARRNYTPIVQAFIAVGAKLNCRDKHGETALTCAASWGSTEAIKLLILAGSHVNQVTSAGFTPLMHAAKFGAPAAVEALIKSGAKINIRAGFRGKTALMLASERGRLSTVQLLLHHGAKPALKDNRDRTAFAYATQNQHHDVATLLSEYGTTTKIYS